MLGISVSGLMRLPDLQMELPLEGSALDDPVLRPGSPTGLAHRALDAAAYDSREAFGWGAVTRAGLLDGRARTGPGRGHLTAREDL